MRAFFRGMPWYVPKDEGTEDRTPLTAMELQNVRLLERLEKAAIQDGDMEREHDIIRKFSNTQPR